LRAHLNRHSVSQTHHKDMSKEQKGKQPYIRDARPSEFAEIGRLQCRAFANDPVMNWFGSVPDEVEVPSRSALKNKRDMPKHFLLLYYFYNSLTRATDICGGRIVVVVVPNENDTGERILSAALWMPPAAKVDSIFVIAKSRQHRTMFGDLRSPGGWGFTGFSVQIGFYLGL
jgi:hypothetical protein